MLPTCSTRTFLITKQKHNEEIANKIYIWIKRLKIFLITGLSGTPNSFRIGSVSLIRQIQTLNAESSCPRTWGRAPPHDKHMATPAWLLRSFLLRYATVLLARVRKAHLVPWDQKVYSLKFKLCLKLSQWKIKTKKGYLLTYPHLSLHVDLFFAWLTYCRLHFSLVSTFHKKRFWIICYFFAINSHICIYQWLLLCAWVSRIHYLWIIILQFYCLLFPDQILSWRQSVYLHWFCWCCSTGWTIWICFIWGSDFLY